MRSLRDFLTSAMGNIIIEMMRQECHDAAGENGGSADKR